MNLFICCIISLISIYCKADEKNSPAMEGIHYFAARNGCDTNSVEEVFDGYVKRYWKNGTGVTQVECYLTLDGGHSWPGAAKHRPRADPPSERIDANTLIWNFFKRFSLP